MDALSPLRELLLRGQIGLVPVLVGMGGGEADERVEGFERFLGWVGMMDDEVYGVFVLADRS